MINSAPLCFCLDTSSKPHLSTLLNPTFQQTTQLFQRPHDVPPSAVVALDARGADDKRATSVGMKLDYDFTISIAYDGGYPPLEPVSRMKESQDTSQDSILGPKEECELGKHVPVGKRGCRRLRQ